ncbi:MAG: HmuY family protein [Bernardetiaceae bacterium]
MNHLKWTTLLLLALLLGACSSDDDEATPAAEPLEVLTVNDLAADPTTGRDPDTGAPISSGRFTFFSLRQNAIVANTDSATANWDIAFRGTTIWINGGAVRSGQGGAYIHTGLFDELTSIPDNQTFAQDNSTADLAIPAGSGAGWYNYNPGANTITPIPGRVLVIRTADGRFAKLEIVSYYRGAPAEPTMMDPARYYTFRYAFQPDGSRNF